MVVDNVHDHTDAPAVGGVDEPLEPVRTAVGLVDGEQTHAVVAPAVAAREGVDGQQLDGVDAERHQVVEPFDGGVEGAGRGERADVQLVEDAPGQRQPSPGTVRPAEQGVVDEPGATVDALGLIGGARVRQFVDLAVDQVGVLGAVARNGHVHPPPTAVVGQHLVDGFVATSIGDHTYRLRLWHPDAESAHRYCLPVVECVSICDPDFTALLPVRRRTRHPRLSRGGGSSLVGMRAACSASAHISGHHSWARPAQRFG